MGTDDGALALQVRNWLAANWHGTDDGAWRERVREAGWSVPSWPAEASGRGLSRRDAQIVAREFGTAGAPGGGADLNPWVAIAGNTVLEFGSPELKRELLPRFTSGEWTRGCLLYSEPGNGSDLAGLQTRAVREGGTFVVNGQKIWTTGGREAQFGMLIARTDWDVPKHAGISFFVLPMDLPGIEVRPIRQMTGEAEFNEIFLTDVRVPAGCLVGDLNNGWRVLQTALKEERRTMGFGGGGTRRGGGDTRPAIFTAADDLIEAARTAGKLDDEDVRQEIMRVHALRLVNDWTAVRAGQQIRAEGGSSLASLGKLAKSRILNRGWSLRYRLLGARGMLYDPEDKGAYEVDHQLMFTFFNSIGGGTDQIQRNIIAERILGLPKGHEPDKGVPFRDVLKGGSLQDPQNQDPAER